MTGSRGRLAIKVHVETVLAGIFGVLAVVTTLWPTWIESITGLEPDAESGVAEWAVVVVFATAAVGAGALARRDYRNLKAAR
jgi:hypothetical protein